MAIEIRELVIRAVIADGDQESPGDSAASDMSDKDKIVQECVDQVLKIIRRTKNR
jgi:hypothetical protein